MTGPSWRGNARSSNERGYGARWQRERLRFLQAHPCCEMCAKEKPPRVTAATVVDHKIAHRGDQKLFWDQSNWQAICALHHNSDCQVRDKGGKVPVRIGLDGFPLDADAG